MTADVERLERLLHLQAEASQQRAQLVDARDALIPADTDITYVTSDVDAHVRQLTDAICDLDDEIARRDEEITVLAALTALDPEPTS